MEQRDPIGPAVAEHTTFFDEGHEVEKGVTFPEGVVLYDEAAAGVENGQQHIQSVAPLPCVNSRQHQVIAETALWTET